jgi:hypothetical protein
VFRRLEASINSISKSIGSLSDIVTRIQSDSAKVGALAVTAEETMRKLMTELNRLELGLKEHMSDHVGSLSESLLGRSGFWRGIFLVIGVQATGWVIFEVYRNRRDNGKKLL